MKKRALSTTKIKKDSGIRDNLTILECGDKDYPFPSKIKIGRNGIESWYARTDKEFTQKK